ncbi:PH domain-containing protein [Streptomyces longwoodensis]
MDTDEADGPGRPELPGRPEVPDGPEEPDGPEGPVGPDDALHRAYRRVRPVPAQTVLLMVSGALVVASATLMASTSEPAGWAFAATATWIVTLVLHGLDLWWTRTLVTPDGITARGRLGTRVRAWHEVYDVRLEPGKRPQGTTAVRWPAYLYDTGGHRVRLPHLDEQQLLDPAAEIARLRATAARRGLYSWSPRPELEARIARAARRRTAWQRAVVTCLVLMAAAFVLDTALLFTDQAAHASILVLCAPLAALAPVFLAWDRVGEGMWRRAARRA